MRGNGHRQCGLCCNSGVNIYDDSGIFQPKNRQVHAHLTSFSGGVSGPALAAAAPMAAALAGLNIRRRMTRFPRRHCCS